jgi:hypothetical protein
MAICKEESGAEKELKARSYLPKRVGNTMNGLILLPVWLITRR